MRLTRLSMRRVPSLLSTLRGSRGQVLVLFALGLPVLLGGLGLSIDIGLAFVSRVDAQKVADAAAIAGADYRLTGISTGSASTPQLEATLYAQKNGFTASQIDARLGTSTFQVACTHCTSDSADNYMEVTITKTRPTFFARVLGISSTTITARAVALTHFVPKNYALIVLDSTACPAYSSSSNLTINNGGAMVNSSCSTGAVSESGGSIVTAVDTDGTGPLCDSSTCTLDHFSKGTVVLSNNSTASPPWANVPAGSTDPLSCSSVTNGWNPPPGNTGLCKTPPFPCTNSSGTTPLGCVPASATSKGSVNNPQTTNGADCTTSGYSDGLCHFQPGTYYGGLSISAASKDYKFDSGIYVLAGGGSNGGFSYQSGNISGTGVTFYNTDDRSANQANARACGVMSITGSGIVNFTAPTSGPSGTAPYTDGWKNMLFWQSPNCATSDGTYTANNPAFRFAGSSTGGAWSTTGIMYAPKAEMQVTGGGSFGSVQIIVDTFNLGGGNAAAINYTNYINTGRSYVKLVE